MSGFSNHTIGQEERSSTRRTFVNKKSACHKMTIFFISHRDRLKNEPVSFLSNAATENFPNSIGEDKSGTTAYHKDHLRPSAQVLHTDADYYLWADYRPCVGTIAPEQAISCRYRQFNRLSSVVSMPRTSRRVTVHTKKVKWISYQ